VPGYMLHEVKVGRGARGRMPLLCLVPAARCMPWGCWLPHRLTELDRSARLSSAQLSSAQLEWECQVWRRCMRTSLIAFFPCSSRPQVCCWDDGRVLVRAQPAEQQPQQPQQLQQQAGSLWSMAPVEKVGGQQLPAA
jgi:hypothetical protein